MGASSHFRWVIVVAAVSLAVAMPASAQQPAGPDASPGSSSTPRPDPAPVKSKPKVVVRQVAPRPVTTTPVVTTPATPARATPAPAARKATHHAKKAARREHRAAAPKHRPRPVTVSLPHISLAHLATPPPTNDAGRARKLAAGALSLLILALASATLLAFTARVERRRVAR